MKDTMKRTENYYAKSFVRLASLPLFPVAMLLGMAGYLVGALAYPFWRGMRAGSEASEEFVKRMWTGPLEERIEEASCPPS